MEERYVNMPRRRSDRGEAPPRRQSDGRKEPPKRRPPRREEPQTGRSDYREVPLRRQIKGKRSPAAAVALGLYKTLVVLSAIIVAVYLGAKLMIREPPQKPMEPPPQQGGTTVPGVGDGSAADPVGGLEREEGVYTFFLAATDKAGSLTDVMMVMRYDTNRQTVGVVSIPRDTLVAREKGNPHLGYGSGGMKQRIVDVSSMLGIPIDFYVKVNINGFVTLVDYLNGVDFYVPCNMDYDDPAQDLYIHYKEGQQHLNGRQAMEVARFRKNNDGSGYTDVGRTETQQKLLVALAKKVLSWGNITKINGFVDIFNDNVDTDLSLNQMLYFAGQAINMDPSTGVETATLPGRGDGVYRGSRYCYELDPEETLELVNRLINPYQQDMTLEDMNLAKAERYM